MDRVIVCWLALETHEISYLEGIGTDRTRAAESFWLQRVNGAQQRFLAAVRALALARKMAVPEVVQIIARQRVERE